MKYILNILIVFILFLHNVNAELVTDGTTGLQVTIAATNNEYQITENLGTKVGGNLFHSFSAFNVEANTTATFSGSADINNIITRVTGDGASTINGSLNSSIEGASFWLLNPNGVVVGEGASFDITGDINISTADTFTFEDGEIFGTVSGKESSILSVSSPVSFGFLSDNSSSIVFDNSDFSIQNNKLVLVSRSVTFSKSKIDLINAEMNIVASNTQTSIDLDQLNSMEFNSNDFGDVNLIDTDITIEDDSALPIVIKAKKLDMVNSSISALKSDMVETDNVQITVDTIAMNQSNIQAYSIVDLMKNSDSTNIRFNHSHFPVYENTSMNPDIVIGYVDDKVSIDSGEVNENEFEFINTLTDNSNSIMPGQEVIELAGSSCQKMENNSTFSILSQNDSYFDPMSFNPGESYSKLDLNEGRDSTYSGDHAQNFIGCNK